MDPRNFKLPAAMLVKEEHFGLHCFGDGRASEPNEARKQSGSTSWVIYRLYRWVVPNYTN